MHIADPRSKRLSRRYALRHFVALAVVGALIIAAHAHMVGKVGAQRLAAHEVEVAASQAALAHQVALSLTRLSAEGASPALLGALRAARDQFRAQHLALVLGDPTMDLAGIRSAALGRVYFDAPHRLDARAQALIRAADRALLAAAPLPPAELRAAADLLRGPLMAGLNAAVLTKEAAAAAAIDGLIRRMRWVLAGVLTMVFTLSFFTVLPALIKLRRAGEALRAAEAELAHALRHDPTTDLANRRGLVEFVEMALANAAAQDLRLGLCKFDLGGLRLFREVNGRAAGDAALRLIADAIREETRKGDLVARIGPDEFAVVSPAAASQDQLVALSRRVTLKLTRSFEVEGARCDLDATAAVVFAAAGERDTDRLLVDLDIAMAEAKDRGRDACGVFTPALRAAFEGRERLRAEIKAALDADQFEPHFQPQICARTGRVDGFEALARWRHPRRGLLTPDQFLRHAVAFGLGDRLDETIMEKSLDAMARWRDRGLKIPRVGVNFSDAQLRDPFMAEKIKWAVERRELRPDNVCIEILETFLMEEAGEETARNLEGLARTGFGLDLDDFGTGRASIGTLQKFNVDRIKIDRSFVTAIDEDEEQQKVTGAMINLAHSLGAEALAEGVETAGEARKLAEMGCNYFQGFLIGRPMPVEDVEEWLRGYEVGINAAVARAG